MNKWFLVAWDIEDTVFFGPYDTEETARDRAKDEEMDHFGGIGLISLPMEMLKEPE